ncbi:MAG: MFS transporter [Candidatus Daviesbacteria bacterium]|nr:MFS transporter [Candidatus Daviesbacteria bacterium]
MSIFHISKFPFNRALRILLISNAMVLIAGAMLGPIYALFVEQTGGDLLDASLAGSVFAFAAGITVLLSGKYADKIKQKNIIVIIGYIIMGIGFLLYTMVNSMQTLLLVQIVIGFGGAIYNPSFDALYSESLDQGKNATEWGAWEAINYFSIAVGAIIGGFIVTNFGFTPLFVVMSLLCFLSALYLYKIPKKIL